MNTFILIVSLIILQSTLSQGFGSLKVYVYDAATGRPIVGATVSAYGNVYHYTYSGATQGDGTYLFSSIISDLYTLKAYKMNYINITVQDDVGVNDYDTKSIYLPQSVTTGGASWRAVLTWNNDVNDLDAHILTSCGCHISYLSKYCSVYKNNTSNGGYISLDRDDSNGEGPETMSLQNLQCGTYDYWVHIRSFNSFVSTNAIVSIYHYPQEITTWNAPLNSDITYSWWNPFTIIVNPDQTYQINTPNTVLKSQPSNPSWGSNIGCMNTTVCSYAPKLIPFSILLFVLLLLIQ